MAYCDKMTKFCGDYPYLIFRLIVGFLFFSHGLQKLTPFLGGPFGGWMMVTAGWLELLIGLAIFFGFLTRLAAVGGIIVMAVAYFMSHLGTYPTAQGGGETAILYFAAFLVIKMMGAKKWSLDKLLFKKEPF